MELIWKDFLITRHLSLVTFLRLSRNRKLLGTQESSSSFNRDGYLPASRRGERQLPSISAGLCWVKGRFRTPRCHAHRRHRGHVEDNFHRGVWNGLPGGIGDRHGEAVPANPRWSWYRIKLDLNLGLAG